MKIADRILAACAVILVLVQAMVLMKVPLVQPQSDSSWYYMNVNYLLTGNYVFESFYPSFKEPSQYYPFFGYSFFLYLCHYLSVFTGVSWTSIVKAGQFVMYLASGILIFKMACRHVQRRYLAYLLLLFYLTYYPYFNFTYLVMSETLGVFLLVSAVFFFLRFLGEGEREAAGAERLHAALFMFLAGFSILVRPVFAPLHLVLIGVFAAKTVRRRQYARLLLVAFFFVMPVCQTAFSKYHYGNYQMKSGFGWNLWNRAIHTDGLIPVSSPSLDELLTVAQLPSRDALAGTFWYDVTIHLSQLGYKERFIQDLCYRVARDGIKEHPGLYLLNTFRNGFQVFRDGMRVRGVKESLSEYDGEFSQLAKERHNKPLMELLSRQTAGPGDSEGGAMLSLNRSFSALQPVYNVLFHNMPAALLFLLVPAIALRYANGLREVLPVPWLAGVCVIFGSTLFEAPDDRYMLPAVLFMAIAMVQAIDHCIAGEISANVPDGR